MGLTGRGERPTSVYIHTQQRRWETTEVSLIWHGGPYLSATVTSSSPSRAATSAWFFFSNVFCKLQYYIFTKKNKITQHSVRLKKEITGFSRTLFSRLMWLSCRHQGWLQIRPNTWKSLNRFAPVFTFVTFCTTSTPRKIMNMWKKGAKKQVSPEFLTDETRCRVLTSDVIEVVAVQLVLKRGNPHCQHILVFGRQTLTQLRVISSLRKGQRTVVRAGD